ncbi:MAG TPA: ABC transporter ATP-binding protein [Pirellulales bacterium]|jgi:ABC-2 type transport system ATP-binding protein|nr:ABC transporter ATP-binding protein [Pirellulales bacterium]
MQRLATAAMPDRAIDVQTLVKQYRAVTALAGVSLSIGQGSIYGLIGSNGAGKTTLIRILMGLTPPTAGRAMVLGQDVSLHANRIRPRIGYVPENHYLYSWMTVESLLEFVRSFYPSWNDRLCRELLALFAIDRRKKIKQLSKGMVVKLALVIAMAHDPPLLILDEPTSGLDPLVRADFLDAVAERHRVTGQTVLFSSHILSDIQALASDIGILHDGRLLASGTIEQLQKSMRVVRLELPTHGQAIAVPRKTLWHGKKEGEYWLAIADYDDAALAKFKAKNRLGVIAVRDVTLDEVYLYHVRGSAQHAAATAVERSSA